MPAGGAGSFGIGTAWTFRRIVPGGDSMVTRSSNFPLPSMSAAARTVTLLRPVPAGEAAGAVGGGLSTAWEGDGSGATDADVPGVATAIHRQSAMATTDSTGGGLGDADGSGPGSADGSDPGFAEESGAGVCDGSGASPEGWASCCDPGAGGSWARTEEGTMIMLASSNAVWSTTTPLKRARRR